MTSFDKIKRKLIKIRLKPIEVFVFHQASKSFDPSTMWECDWTEIEQFKRNILLMKQKYTFISLTEAYEHLQHDIFRCRKYAVLTSDDGWSSLKEILPWLNEQNIPVTLFLNPAYLRQEEVRDKTMDKLLHEEDINTLLENHTNLTIGSHGWNHRFCTDMNKMEFKDSVDRSVAYLRHHKQFIPFFAYSCGRHQDYQDRYLKESNLTPVYCDGMKNYNQLAIHRECIDKLVL